MAKIDTAQLAELLGQTDDAAFEQAVNAAVADLERKLKYPLCGSIEPELRTFNYRPGDVWLKTHPFYSLVSLVVVRNGVETEVNTSDLMYGQNGQLYGSWYNGIKICDTCPGYRCPSFAKCDYIKVTALWGFAEPATTEESGEGDITSCTLPDDLYNVLKEAVEKSLGADDLQSESTQTRSYTKFASAYKSVWEKYADIIEFYALRESVL